MKEYKILAIGEEATEKLQSGANQVCDMVKLTLGPYGQNVVIDQARIHRKPRITNDGVTIARFITLKDDLENQGAQVVIQGALKTNELCGDGTTSTMVLIKKILDEVKNKYDFNNKLGGSDSVVKVKKQLETEAKEVIEKLKKQAKAVKTDEDLNVIAKTAVEDEEMGMIIADMMRIIGNDGHIVVEDTYGEKIETEIVSGMRFEGKYAEDFMITKPGRKEAEMKDPLIFITNQEIEDVDQIAKVTMTASQAGVRNIVIFSPNFTRDVLLNMYKSLFFKDPFRVLAIKTPSLLKDMYRDIAIYTGGKFYDKKTFKDDIRNFMLEDFGRAKSVMGNGVENGSEVFITKGKGDKKEIEKQVAKIKEQIKIEPVEDIRNRFKRRIASLSGGVGIIRMGARSDVSKYYRKDKIDDAIYATKAALEEGIVKGGGLALKDIAKTLPKDYLLKEILKAPFEQIVNNSGGQLTEKDMVTIFDPAKVVRISLENAIDVASTLITAGGIIANKRNDIDDLRHILSGTQPHELSE